MSHGKDCHLFLRAQCSKSAIVMQTAFCKHWTKSTSSFWQNVSMVFVFLKNKDLNPWAPRASQGSAGPYPPFPFIPLKQATSEKEVERQSQTAGHLGAGEFRILLQGLVQRVLHVKHNLNQHVRHTPVVGPKLLPVPTTKGRRRELGDGRHGDHEGHGTGNHKTLTSSLTRGRQSVTEAPSAHPPWCHRETKTKKGARMQ